MPFFKHSELVKQYHVSMKTVYNWIDAAKQGKLDLELTEEKGKVYISNKQGNVAVLERLAHEGKKYRNSRSQKVVTPSPEFYELFSRRQILDIITSLRTHGEIPRQYNYFAEGAVSWDEVMQRDAKEVGLDNMLKGSQELIRTNLEAIDRLTEGYTRINVVDIGPGNAYPVQGLLEHLVERGVLHRYIAVDISQEMLNIAERHVKGWFGDKVKFEGYIRDFTYERFNDVLVDDMLDESADETLNLMLFLGCIPANFRHFSDPIKTIYGSMAAGDLLIYTDKPDTETSRHYFEFGSKPGLGVQQLAPGHRFVLDLLNVTEDLYEVEKGFDERQLMRYVRVRLNTAVTIRFQFAHGQRDITLEKGTTILLLRVWHKSSLELIDEFQQTGLRLLQSSMTKDRNYLLAVFGVDEVDTTV